MFWTNTRRIIRSGFVNFSRNSLVALSSILIMTVTLSFITSLIFFRAVLDNSLAVIKNRVDITVYFTPVAVEDRIFALKSSLEKLPEVVSVEYTSAEQALTEFRKRHSEDYTTLQALDELDINPLGGFVNIKARETSQYESVAKILESETAPLDSGIKIVDKVDYHQNKAIIDKLTIFTDKADSFGLIMTLALIFVSFIITFNTIRLAIYVAREEIGVMRLVGANNWYIRGPFIVEGMIYGALSAVITLVIFYPISLWLGDSMTSFLSLNMFKYYFSNLFNIMGIVFGAGLGLGALSSFWAVRKYLDK